MVASDADSVIGRSRRHKRGYATTTDDPYFDQLLARARQMPKEQLIPKFVPLDEDVTLEDLEKRASSVVVPPPFFRTGDHYTPENRVLASYMECRDFAFTFTRAYDAMVSNTLRRQWRDIGFTVDGVQFDFVNLLFSLPEIQGRPLYPSYARDHRDASYSAKETTVLRLTDASGRTRDLRLPVGKIPVMLGSVLCNLHPSNQRYEDVGAVPTPAPLAPVVGNRATTDVLSDRERLKQREFYRRHNESTTGHLPIFIICGSEQVGISGDKQRVSMPQMSVTPGCRPMVRFIATGVKTSNVTVLFNDKRIKSLERKKRGGTPTLQIHVSDTMRNNVLEQYVSIFVPFHFCGWDYDRVIAELRPFVVKDENVWQRVQLEMAVSYREFQVLLEVSNGDLYDCVRTEMRDKGRNPCADGRAYSRAQVERLLLEGMFRHMNGEYPRAGWNTPEHIAVNDRKLRLLLLLVADLLLYFFGVTPVVDRDSWERKKLVTIVRQMQNLHMLYLLEVRRQWIRWARQEPIRDIMTLDADAYAEQVLSRFDMTKTFERSMTGKLWGVILPNNQRKPNALQCHEKLQRGSLYVSIAQSNRTHKPVNPQVKESKSRDHHPLGEGVICGLETPAGLHVGLSEHKTVTSVISIQVDDWPVLAIVRRLDAVRTRPDATFNTALLVNGKFMNWCEAKLERVLRRFKRLGILDIYTSIVLTAEPRRQLEVFTDEGRVLFPALVVDEETGQVLADRLLPGVTDFPALLAAGCIEFVDPRERRHKQFTYDRHDLVLRTRAAVDARRLSEQRLVAARAAADPRSWRSMANLVACERVHDEICRHSCIHYVHMDPSAQLGVSASLVPFIQKNYAVRSGFSAQMVKQSIGNYVSNIATRTDVTGYQLMYGSAPGYHTVVGDSIGRDAYHGILVTQLIAGDRYTPEDSVAVNRRAVDAGLYGFYLRKRKDIEEEQHLRFGIAPNRRHLRAKYRHITSSGLPRRGALIREDEVLVARTAYGVHAEDVYLEHGECAIVDSVHIIRDGTSDLRRVLIILRHFFEADIGTKLTSIHSQKVTVGDIRAHHDMPSVMGKPELIIQQIGSPIPLAGRVTMGSMDELLFSRTYGLGSLTMNATPFARYDPARHERLIIESGYRPNGMERILLPDGTVALKRAFVGRMYIIVLPHFAAQKLHVRGQGPVEVGTGQPVQGRTHRGGLRVSLMDVAALLSSSCSAQVVERLMLHADATVYIFCSKCSMRFDTLFYRGSRCRACLSKDFVRVNSPMALRFLENLMVVAFVDFRLSFHCPDGQGPATEWDAGVGGSGTKRQRLLS